MDRREFLEILAASLASATVRPESWAGKSLHSAAGTDFRAWVWFHASRPDDSAYWSNRFKALRDAGVTGVLVEGANTRVIADAAHANGIEFHRWIFTMYRFFDARVKREHPEWFSVSRNGESSLTRPPYVPQYNWLCPTREPVRDYLRGIVDGIARRPEVDGVHLDYVRFPNESFDYSPAALELFKTTIMPGLTEKERREAAAREVLDPAAYPNLFADRWA